MEASVEASALSPIFERPKSSTFVAPLSDDDDVCRLQVAVDDPFFVRRRECRGDGRSQLHHAFDRETAPVDERVERPAIDQLHRQEVGVAILLDRVDGDDVRVVQCGERARLAAEAFDALRVGGDFRRKHFEGDVAPEGRVGGAVDGSHSAATDEGLDGVATESGTGLHRAGHITADELVWGLPFKVLT